MNHTYKKEFRRRLLSIMIVLAIVFMTSHAYAEDIQTTSESKSEENITKTISYETIPSVIIYQEDDTIYPDEERVLQEGQDGRNLITTIKNLDTGKEEVLKEVIKEKIDTIILKGTKPYPVDDQSELVKALQEQTESLKRKIESLEKELKNKGSSSNQNSEIARLQSQLSSLQSSVRQQSSRPSSNSSTSNDLNGVKTSLDTIAKKLDELQNREVRVTTPQPTQPITQPTTQQPPRRQPNQTSPNITSRPANQERDANGNIIGELDGQASTEYNLSNANQPFSIYRGDPDETYSADARQFLTFATKDGNTFHLIVNHDQNSENVLMLTEVSEEDLLALTASEKKDEEVVEEEPVFTPVEQELVVEEPPKKESKGLGSFAIIAIVFLGALGVGYYMKNIRGKEEENLKNLEEADEEDYYNTVNDESLAVEDEYFDDEELEEAGLLDTEEEELKPVAENKPSFDDFRKQKYGNSSPGYTIEIEPEETEE